MENIFEKIILALSPIQSTTVSPACPPTGGPAAPACRRQGQVKQTACK